MGPDRVYVGIDVSKAQLDIAVRPSGDEWRKANRNDGISQVVGRREELDPELVVLEATGDLQLPLTGGLAAAHLPVVVVNPRQVRTLLRPLGGWLRPISWTLKCLHTLLKVYVLNHEPFPTPRPRNSPPSRLAGARWGDAHSRGQPSA